MKKQTGKRDQMQIAANYFTARRIDRRTFLGICAAAGVAPYLLESSEVEAADKPAQIVHADWGGDAIRCFDSSYNNAFTAETGVKVMTDGTGPLEGKVKAMVDAKKAIWDTVEVDCFSIPRLAKQGLLETIDYSIVDKSKIQTPYTWDNGVLQYWFSNVLTYDKTKVGAEVSSWADFWDIEKYPGKRALFKYMMGALEAALMADGVPMEKVYPLDLDRALKKIASIKDHLVFYSSGAESQQMFQQGEIVMGQLWSTRANILEVDTKGRVGWTWNQGVAEPGGLVIPKGNPAGREWANRYIAWMQDPKRQIEVLNCMGLGPANPAAVNMMTNEQLRLHPAAPENFKLQVPVDADYYAEHYDDALNAYLAMISA